jgi:RNA polymerase sigma-70 factor, ECF subfamily
VKTDEQLVEAALRGSAAAFRQLVDRYQNRLFRFLLARSASRADAEDALQDTFMNAFRYLPSYRPRWRFSTWLYRIAIRRAWKQRPADMERFEEGPDESADPLLSCIRDSDLENVWLAAKRLLSPDAQTALWLRYVEDMTVNEVARALERSPAWTKVTLLRARRRLGRALADETSNASENNAYGQL